MPRIVRVLFLVVVAAACIVPAVGADDQFERLVAGLRQRRLFALAEDHCRRQLANPKLEADLRGRATVELLRVLAELAAQSPPAKRRELLAATQQLSSDFARTQPDHPRALLVRAQEALGVLAVGEVVRREAELVEAARGRDPSEPAAADGARSADGTGEASTYADARTLLRDGMRLVDTLDRELAQLIPQRFRKPLPPPALTAEELVALQANLRFQLVLARRQMALCYPAESADRTGGLAAALQTLDKTLTPMPHDDPLAPRLRLERATLLRLLTDRSEAAAALADEAWRDAPAPVRLAARAERLRLMLDAGQPREALPLAAVDPAETDSPSAELDFARLELYLALWGRAEATKTPESADEAARWEQLAVRTLEQIDARHGLAWRRRGDLLLVRRATSGQGPRSLAALRRTADSFYLQGRLDDAVAAYTQAASQAQQAGDQDERFQLAYKAALIEQQRGRHAVAAQRLTELAAALAKNPQAAAAHHLASWNLAQELRTAAPAAIAPDTARYQQSLERQIEVWPDDATTQEARVWLGKLRESRRDWSGAAEAYRGVDRASPHYAAALEGAGRAWLTRLQELRTNPAARRAEAEAAGKFFEQAAFGTGPESLERWTEPQQAATVVAARAWFESGGPHLARTERLLRTALEHSPDAPQSWRATVRALLLVALAGQDSRRADAESLVKEIGALPATVLMEAADRIGVLRAGASGDAQISLARLELAVLQNLAKRTAELPPDARQRLIVNQAAALTAAGQRDEALAAYRELAKARPQDATVHETLAELLSSGSKPAEWREALDEWRRIAAKSQPRTARWYRAKLGVASAEHQLGHHQAAAQLIRFLQVTPPGLADTPLEPQFLELLRRCEDADKK